jgi:serine/threonine-protein kinase
MARIDPTSERGRALTEAELSAVRLRGDELLGELIAGRRIEARLAAGAQAVIYRTVHEALGRREVLKVLRPSQNPKSVERFLHEAQVLSTIRSPYIPTIYDYGTTLEGRSWLAMEYVDGISLGDLIAREGRLSLPRALTIAEQLCLVLAEAHAHDTIHRDLKPDNVLIERGEQGERVRLLDFGVAHLKDHKLTLPGRVYGTPGYLAPEQLDGSTVDGRCDLFALGVVLHEMLTGTNPYQVGGHSLTEMFGRLMVRFETPLPPLSASLSGVPPSIDAWLHRLLAKDRNERPDDALEVARGLGAVRDALRLSAHGARVDLVTGLTPPPRGLAPELGRHRWPSPPASLVGDVMLPPSSPEQALQLEAQALQFEAQALHAQAELLEAERTALEGRARLVARQNRQLEEGLAALRTGGPAEVHLMTEVLGGGSLTPPPAPPSISGTLAARSMPTVSALPVAAAQPEPPPRSEAPPRSDAPPRSQHPGAHGRAADQAPTHLDWVGRVALALATGGLGVAIGVYLAG